MDSIGWDSVKLGFCFATQIFLPVATEPQPRSFTLSTLLDFFLSVEYRLFDFSFFSDVAGRSLTSYPGRQERRKTKERRKRKRRKKREDTKSKQLRSDAAPTFSAPTHARFARPLSPFPKVSGLFNWGITQFSNCGTLRRSARLFNFQLPVVLRCAWQGTLASIQPQDLCIGQPLEDPALKCSQK